MLKSVVKMLIGLPLPCVDLLWPFTLPSFMHACLHTHTSQGLFHGCIPFPPFPFRISFHHKLFSSGSMSSQHNLIPLHLQKLTKWNKHGIRLFGHIFFLARYGPFPILFLFNFSGKGLLLFWVSIAFSIIKDCDCPCTLAWQLWETITRILPIGFYRHIKFFLILLILTDLRNQSLWHEPTLILL